MIEYVPYQKINKQKWDDCIDRSFNGLIYAYSFYLDELADNWDALVLNDYEAVMPLTWRKKYNIYYLYQPFFCASLGIFAQRSITIDLAENFLQAVPAKFKYWDISLNHANNFIIPEFGLYERMNYVLDLNKPYEELYTHFNTNIKRNIKKAESLGCTVAKDIFLSEILVLSREILQSISPIEEEDYNNFSELYKILKGKEIATNYAVYSSQKELLASCIFFFSHNRAYYILVGNHPNGKTVGASHLLINAFIKDYAGKELLLDFEGSDIRNLAFFYSSFGAVEEKYGAIKLNRLPKLLKWMKN
ncbi:MAG: hypothetical protein HYR66_01590 [Sphingobacteriales bacterium]|nr:hypothetical protein [Sphingobacteriales bacterium]MBI3719624.1 hypothetical protein [Sphingobacteriales bacterium]